MKRRTAALALPLCLMLTACEALPAREEAPPPSRPATLLEEASGLTEEETLLTVDGRTVPAWQYLYWLACTCDSLSRRYAEAELPLDWSAPAGEGSLADYAKEQALHDTALCAVVENWGEAYGAACSQTGGTPFPQLDLTEEQAEALEHTAGIYAGLLELCRTGRTALAPGTEDLAAFADAAGAMTLDRILVKGGDDRSAAQARAAGLFSQLNGAQDQAAEFTRLAAECDDPAGPRTLLPRDGALEDSLFSAAQALAENQCSGILESPEGFSILRRLPLDPEPLREAWFDDALERAVKSAAVTPAEAYAALDAAAFYNALQQARQSRETPAL